MMFGKKRPITGSDPGLGMLRGSSVLGIKTGADAVINKRGLLPRKER